MLTVTSGTTSTGQAQQQQCNITEIDNNNHTTTQKSHKKQQQQQQQKTLAGERKTVNFPAAEMDNDQFTWCVCCDAM